MERDAPLHSGLKAVYGRWLVKVSGDNDEKCNQSDSGYDMDIGRATSPAPARDRRAALLLSIACLSLAVSIACFSLVVITVFRGAVSPATSVGYSGFAVDASSAEKPAAEISEAAIPSSSYRVAEDVSEIESAITSSYMDGKDFVVEFINPMKEEVHVDGLATGRYSLEGNRLVVYDYKNERFKLVIGSASDVYEFGITVINVQSYPVVGGEWRVGFATEGIANLTIRATGGTTWTDYAESGHDLKFLEVKCGNRTLDYEWIGGAAVFHDYSCDEDSTEISKVLTTGKHTLEFRFGDSVVYAYNQAGLTRLKTVEYFINTSKTQVASNAWYNSTFYVQLPESGVSVESAWLEISGISPRGAAGAIRSYLNGTYLGNQTIGNRTGANLETGGIETFAFTYLVNSTTSAAPTNGLYGISDTSNRAYVLALRPTSAYNVLSAKAFITYAYEDTSSTQLHTEQFYVNQSMNTVNFASNAWFNSTFDVQLAGTNPSVKSAWFEIGGEVQHTSASVATLTVALNGSQAHQSPFNIADAGSTDETAFHMINVNATNTATSVYSITNNRKTIFNLGMKITNEISTAPNAKLYVTYTAGGGFSNQTTHEIFVNSSGAAVTANTWQNWTFPLQLLGSNPRVLSAWFEIYGGSIDSASRGQIQANLNNTAILTNTNVTLGFSESGSFRVFANASKIINDVTDNSRRIYLLNISCRVLACNSLSAKLILTYNSTTMPNQTTVKFLVNSSSNYMATNAWHNTTYYVALGNTPLVQRAFYDIVGSNGGTTGLTMTARSGPATIPYDTSVWDSSAQDTPFYNFRSVYNATNSTTTQADTPYEINDGLVHDYDLDLRCTGSPCFNLGSKLVMLYSFSDTVVSSAPKFSNNQTMLVGMYNPAYLSNFTVTWTDDSGSLSNVYLEHNDTGTLSNQTMSGTYPNYYLNVTLPAGAFRYRFVAIDASGLQNATSVQYFSVA
ncbi:MAG: hypothetical protein NT016_00365, partial [Candidatus Aenigmarchaeota archaeon]|nr:hypothetical protein [Candidatus Aenigmarchaeota archaeon]